MEQDSAACYVYCVAPASDKVNLGAIGIENREVYTIVHQGLCAVIHDCSARPYESGDREVAATWVMAHHRVVEVAWKRWGTVLPLTFNTLIKVGGGSSASEKLETWLNMEYLWLKGKLEAFVGKVEYGVQVFWDTGLVARKVADDSLEVSKLKEEIQSQPRGLAYMYRQKLEGLVRKAMEAKAAEESSYVYDRLSRWVERIHVEKVKRGEGERQMLINLSCLVPASEYTNLAADLEELGERKGYSVRLVGPFPPYSFC